jgi:hypothetical protein
MASESLNVTVYVKSLSGDLIELSVDPSLGLKGVETALTLFDSETYRPFQFCCFFLNEETTELTQDAILGLFLVPESITMHASYRFRVKYSNRTVENDCIVFQITDYKSNLIMKKSLQPAVSYLSIYRELESNARPTTYTAEIHNDFEKRKDDTFMDVPNFNRDTIKYTLTKCIPYITKDGNVRTKLTADALTTISRIISEEWK